jgi:hypothetical protein
MKILTEDAALFCKHGPGHITNKPSQSYVTIASRRILVEHDPIGRPIAGCPSTIPFKPCLTTLTVQKGYSTFIRISDHPVCLDTVTGLTDGTPPGIVLYEVRLPGQTFVAGQA